VTGEGVRDPTALAAAHASAIRDVSYSLSTTQVRHGADRALRSYLSMDLAQAADRSFLARVATAGPDGPKFLGNTPATGVYWSDGDVHLAKIPSDGESTFHSFVPPMGYVGTWKYWAWLVPFGGMYFSGPQRYYSTVFEAIPTRLVERRLTADGPVYRVEGRAARSPSSLETVGASGVRDVTLRASIDRDGVVRSFDASYGALFDGDRVDVRRTIEYADVGSTTVGRPDRGR